MMLKVIGAKKKLMIGYDSFSIIYLLVNYYIFCFNKNIVKFFN